LTPSLQLSPHEFLVGREGSCVETNGLTCYRGVRRMESNGIAAKRRKKRRSYCFYAPFASLRGYSLFRFCSLCYGLTSGCPVFVPAQRRAAPGAGAAQLPPDRLTRRPLRFFLGAILVPVPNPTDEPNRCNLRHVAQKTLQKALYVGFYQIAQPYR